ncbi:MAG: SAM-dependent DNA methyltransferase [Verrucomicrobiota bacterium]|nr:SAM-dependent DNA methyltransferase [Verrucomicrobiota bacterium]
MRKNTQDYIGTVFTPDKWTTWLLKKYNIISVWLDGATVLDPTCGAGNFLEAMIFSALQRGFSNKEVPCHRLYGIDKVNIFLKEFKKRMMECYSIDFPDENLFCSDIITDKLKLKTDILVGNPPWQNFTDLPNAYKKELKPYFLKYNLVKNKKKMLLGASRIDIAALVIAKTIRENLKENGKAVFFLPLSLFLNDGAHDTFRQIASNNDSNFSVCEIYDFAGINAFPNVQTRYGTTLFKKNLKQSFPIPFYVRKDNNWTKQLAKPISSASEAFSVYDPEIGLTNFKKIYISKDAKPRQGANTCGRNKILLFSDMKKENKTLVSINSYTSDRVILPKNFLFPLIDKDCFLQNNPKPERYILLPYNQKTGKILTKTEIQLYPELTEYLQKNKDSLQTRKGTMIKSTIQRGLYWGLLGVGKYSFCKYKVVWKAIGAKKLRPEIFTNYEDMPWQGNQALHAYIPCKSRTMAKDIRKYLLSKPVENYLESFKMQGTMSWLQPGKVSKVFNFEKDEQQLFDFM